MVILQEFIQGAHPTAEIPPLLLKGHSFGVKVASMAGVGNVWRLHGVGRSSRRFIEDVLA